MSSFNLGKKLLPAKKAWRSFTNKFQSRLHNLKLSRALKRSKNLCIRAYNYILPIITRKLHSLINRSSRPPRTRRNFYHHYLYQQCHDNFSAIYVDQLFPGHILKSDRQNTKCTVSAPQAKEFVASSSSSSDVNRSKLEEEEEEMIKRAVQQTRVTYDIDEWRTPSMPHMSGVDRRAHEFISKFHEDMEIERQQSILDFHQMLARGS